MMKYTNMRPYPCLKNWSTEKWLSVPCVYVDWNMLTLTQSQVYTETIINPGHQHSYCGDEHPHVIRFKGENYVEDGHHRLIKQYLSGADCAYVRMVVIDEEDEAA